MNFIIRLILNAVAILITAKLLPGVEVDGFLAAFILAVVLAILNAILKPILIILTIPATVVTLGLFLIVINAGILLLADYFVEGTNIDGFWWAVLFGLIVSILNAILYGLAKDKK
ncbi:MAG: phage holin family protein [Bacteroidota bacterium]